MTLIAVLLLPFVGSLLTPLVPTRARTVLASVAGFISTVAAVGVVSLYPRVRDGGVIREQVSWVPSLGLDIVLRMDGFAWMFAVLITVIGALVWLFPLGNGADLLGVTPAPLEVGIIVLMAAVVFGLSTDYEVFLLSRMVEARARGASTEEAVTVGDG